jgi:hypothetical protein
MIMSDFGTWLVEMAPLDFEHNLEWLTMRYMAGHYFTREQIELARYYIADRNYPGLASSTMLASEVINGIDQHYDGGWAQFAEDSHGVQWDEIINIE